MRLYLCDCALERARLALARREAFAPLNGLVDPSPPPPALPDAAEAARLLEEARKELDAARKLIADCGYHRRDEELAELDEVVAGTAASPICRRASEARHGRGAMGRALTNVRSTSGAAIGLALKDLAALAII